jgi:Flp pilus assembly protein TadD
VSRAGAAALVSALAWASLGAMGCASDTPRTPEQRQARAQTLIDSGNQAYRTGDYRLAMRRYAAATVMQRDDPAAYYGMGMALSKLGRDEEARRAYARARELTQQKRP